MERSEFISQPKISRTEAYQDEFGISSVDFFVRVMGPGPDRHQDDRKMSPSQIQALTGEMQENSGNGVIVGKLTAHFLSQPMPIVYLSHVYTRKDAQGQRVASMLVQTLEQHIRDKGALGVLQDYVGVWPDTPPEAKDMYTRRGWIECAGTTMVFNTRDTPVEEAETIANQIFEMYESRKRDDRFA